MLLDVLLNVRYCVLCAETFSQSFTAVLIIDNKSSISEFSLLNMETGCCLTYHLNTFELFDCLSDTHVFELKPRYQLEK